MTAGIHLLPPVLTAFRRSPDVEPAVTGYEPPVGVAAVATGDVDLALTRAYEPATAEPLPTEAGSGRAG